MQLLNQVKVRKPRKSRFKQDHTVLMTTDFGKITPICCIECLAGDIHQISSNVLVRLDPQLAPVMADCDVRVDYGFVPTRLIWKAFTKFIQGSATDSIPSVPYVNLNKCSQDEDMREYFLSGSLADYMGVAPLDMADDMDRTKTYKNVNMSVLPFLAYQKFYDDYFRDETFEDSLFVEDIYDTGKNVPFNPWTLKGGELDYSQASDQYFLEQVFTLRYRNLRRDYFTANMPYTQEGDPARLSLGNVAPVTGSISIPGINTDHPNAPVVDNQIMVKTSPVQANRVFSQLETDSQGHVLGNVSGWTSSDFVLDLSEMDSTSVQLTSDNADFVLDADLSKATGITVEDLRRLVAVQNFKELKARIGHRFKEFLMGVFGVRISDSRLDRTEYLGGNVTPIIMTEILSQAATDDARVGSQFGHAVSAGFNGTKKFYCEEPGYIIGVMSIIPRMVYDQGVPRMFQHTLWDDFALPQFAHLGEQATRISELYAYDARDHEDSVFGYMPRYSEYKMIPSRLAGDMHVSKRYWTMATKYAYEPVLNADFLSSARYVRSWQQVFPVVDGSPDHFNVQILNRVHSKRPLPYFGTPRLIG